jgi:hypothetical protein
MMDSVRDSYYDSADSDTDYHSSDAVRMGRTGSRSRVGVTVRVVKPLRESLGRGVAARPGGRGPRSTGIWQRSAAEALRDELMGELLPEA